MITQSSVAFGSGHMQILETVCVCVSEQSQSKDTSGGQT